MKMLDEETLKFYIEAIEELIQDEEKILSYTSLANSLSISVNLAKHLLDFYVKNNSEKKIDVAYFVSGISIKNNGVVMAIVDREMINTWNKNVSRILSNHIHSIKKGNSGRNTLNENSLYLTTSFDDYCSQTSTIKSEHIHKRSDDSSQNIRELMYNSLGGRLTKQSTGIKTKTIPKQESKEVDRNHVNNNAPAPIIEHVEKKNTVLSMFGNQKVKSENDNVKSNQKVTENKSHQKTKGIQGFFQKHPAIPKRVIDSKKEEESIAVAKENKPNEEIVNNVNVKSEKPNSQEKKQTEKILEKTAKKDIKSLSTKNKNPLKQNKKNQEAIKRKRVICMSDSDDDSGDKPQSDDDPFEENQVKEHFLSDDEIIPATPIPTAVKPVNCHTNPRKRRKVIDKTYTDDEGYILTKKEVVYESYSEDEDITGKRDDNVSSNKLPLRESVVKVHTNAVEVADTISNGKAKNVKTKKGVAALKNNKQSTLMSFFKKS